MTVFNSNKACELARPYYYEYLYEESKMNIPSDISEHINQCKQCQDEIQRLKSILVESTEQTDDNSKEKSFALITNTTLHFGHIGNLVSCSTAKPFLPSLADPLLKIGIPTPITVHLDKCNQCESDLQKIIELKLTHNQLCRLGQMFSEIPYESQTSCFEANEIISNSDSVLLTDASEEVLKHVSVCPDCKERNFSIRELYLKSLTAKKNTEEFPCEAVEATDLFDICFPYGIEAKASQDEIFESSFAHHVINCTSCLNKMQDLHKIIDQVIERGESGITTCYNVTDESENVIKETDTAETVYNDWPIKVEVIESSEPVVLEQQATVDLKHQALYKGKVARKRILPILKYASVAAAILIFAAIFINTPTAKAVNLADIMSNVQITVLDQITPENSQDIWISQDLNMKIFKSQTQLVLWDIAKQEQKTTNLNTDSTEIVQLDINSASKIEGTMEAPWDLLPFKNAALLPESSQWQKASYQNIETIDADSEVYDLIWQEQSLGVLTTRKCRVFLNTRTTLPYKTQYFEKTNMEDEYKLLTTMNASYPIVDDIRTILQQNDLE
ncbi:MAG: hypothetical protein ACYTE8_13250 [Planctomycetota bacterium]|jgi:hypothetical protein